MIGTVQKTQPLVLHSRIGSADGGKHSYTMMVTEPLRTPMVVRDDGKTFMLTWNDLLDLARSAFAEDYAVKQE
ncbi:hypothetical protein ACQUHS_01955 [Pseudomonas aeruginosa]|uniref:hypothetical protein n=1 Tax=Pseudomonas aeruginosa TaxID=287 RepID=UPI00208F4A01